MEENKSITIADPTGLSLWNDGNAFELGQRMAKALMSSSIVPTAYQGPQNLGSCLIALDVARRMNLSPLVCMQNLNVIKGKPSWGASFLIARVNMSGKYKTPIRYEWSGSEGKDDWGCRAWVIDQDGERINGTKVTIAMAKAEGWYDKNAKWQNMPEPMLTYRAASFFVRANCPEQMIGMTTTTEEYEDIDNGTAVDVTAHEVKEVNIDAIPVVEPAPFPTPIEIEPNDDF